jgi:NADPH:quinone reductase-like Zn-dependent oxidoreductase
MANTMRAIAAASYGPIENLREIAAPLPEPAKGEVRLRVVASALNPSDGKTLLGKVTFLHGKVFPLVVGWDVSGVVEKVGDNVSSLRAGQEVFGFHAYSRMTKVGALAEYTVMPAAFLAPKPESVSHETAAASATAGITALQALRDCGRMRAGQPVLVTGAKGGVGSIAIGVAGRLGGVADAVSSASGMAFVRGLGARTVFDRGNAGWQKEVNERYSVILDAAAGFGLVAFRNLLVPGGTYVTTLPSVAFVGGLLLSPLLRRRCRLVMVRPRRPDLEWLAQGMREGLQIPIAKVVPIREVAAAITDFSKNGTQGKIVVRVDGGF